MQTANYLNTTVVELMDWPLFWIQKAHVAMRAENQARAIKDQHR